MRMLSVLISTTCLVTVPALADTKRELDAHEHGSGVLNIAVEGGTVAMELEAPGADIVGFEYTAESDQDRAAVDTAIADLARPLDLFVVPADAGCKVTAASVSLIGEEDHDDDEHDDHDDHDDHGDDHTEHDHDDHDEKHAEHDHDDHAEGAQHTEFHAEYTLDCAEPSAIDRIEFAYFERFPNALELDIQVVSDAGAEAFEVERDDPVLDMRELF